jgi:hypothetical protein
MSNRRHRETPPDGLRSGVPIAVLVSLAVTTGPMVHSAAAEPPALEASAGPMESGSVGSRSVQRTGGTIALEPIEAGRWRVTYRLDEPATVLRFGRTAQYFREAHWTVLTPGWRLGRDGDSQVLTGDAPADVVVLEMAPYDEVMRAEYRAFQPFSDGSVAMFTGHLYLRDVSDETTTDDPDAAPYVTTLSVVPPAGATAVVLGEAHDGPFEWTDQYGTGTYLYFGTAPAVETEHLAAILDPGLPAWLGDRAASLFPTMFESLREGFAEALPWHPMVLIAWDGGDGGGRSWSGGALPGQIRMSLQGGGWEREDAGSVAELARFIAHEAAHFWNGQIVTNRLREQSWIHEGGADAIAELVLHELGLIDAAALHTAREVAINRCLWGLDGGSVNGAQARGRFGDYYTCGHLMAVWSEAAVAGADPGVDLFHLWARLIDAVGVGESYDQERYFGLLAELGVDREVTEAMARFANRDLADQRRAVTDGFARVGLMLTAGEARPPVPLRRDLARDAVTHLMSTSCGGRYSLSTYDTYLRAYRIDGCDAFQVESDVWSVAGHGVTDGDRLFDAVVDACLDGSPIVFEGARGSSVLTVSCGEALAPRLPWMALSGG